MGDSRGSGEAAMVQPGQIWLIEQAENTAPCGCDRAALISANVVLYDRALEALVAELLPLGGYAEPLPRAATERISPRALRFAAEGWSVVQLVPAQPGCNARLDGITRSLGLAPAADDLPLLAIGKGPGREHRCDGRLGNLPDLLDGFSDDETLTLVLGPAAAPPRPPMPAFTANGLAG